MFGKEASHTQCYAVIEVLFFYDDKILSGIIQLF